MKYSFFKQSFNIVKLKFGGPFGYEISKLQIFYCVLSIEKYSWDPIPSNISQFFSRFFKTERSSLKLPRWALLLLPSQIWLSKVTPMPMISVIGRITIGTNFFRVVVVRVKLLTQIITWSIKPHLFFPWGFWNIWKKLPTLLVTITILGELLNPWTRDTKWYPTS